VTGTMTEALTFRVMTDNKSSTILIYYNKGMGIYTERNGIDYKSSNVFVAMKYSN